MPNDWEWSFSCCVVCGRFWTWIFIQWVLFQGQTEIIHCEKVNIFHFRLLITNVCSSHGKVRNLQFIHSYRYGSFPPSDHEFKFLKKCHEHNRTNICDICKEEENKSRTSPKYQGTTILDLMILPQRICWMCNLTFMTNNDQNEHFRTKHNYGIPKN